MSVLLKRLQVRRPFIVHRPAMVPLPAVHRPLPVRFPVKPATAQPVGSGGGSEGGWYKYFKKQYKEKQFEMAIIGAIYAVLVGWGSHNASKKQDKMNTQSLETSKKVLEICQEMDARTSKILEVCERLESTKPSFFARFTSAFWWKKTQKGKEGKAGGDESGKGER